MVIANQEKSSFQWHLWQKGWTSLTMQTTFMYTLCVNHLSKKQCSQPRRECWKEFSLTPLFKLISIFYLIVRLYDILHIESLRADGILFSFFSSLPLRLALKFLSEKFASVFGWCFG